MFKKFSIALALAVTTIAIILAACSSESPSAPSGDSSSSGISPPMSNTPINPGRVTNFTITAEASGSNRVDVNVSFIGNDENDTLKQAGLQESIIYLNKANNPMVIIKTQLGSPGNIVFEHNYPPLDIPDGFCGDYKVCALIKALGDEINKCSDNTLNRPESLCLPSSSSVQSSSSSLDSRRFVLVKADISVEETNSSCVDLSTGNTSGNNSGNVCHSGGELIARSGASISYFLGSPDVDVGIVPNPVNANLGDFVIKFGSNYWATSISYDRNVYNAVCTGGIPTSQWPSGCFLVLPTGERLHPAISVWRVQ